MHDSNTSLFPQITPDPSTPAGYCLRSAFSDMIDIFEVNRKECARLLLEMPRWFALGTFKPKPGTVPQTDVELKPDMGWQLESTIIEVSQRDGPKKPAQAHEWAFKDNPILYASRSRFSTQTRLLLLFDHGALQTVAIDSWACRGKINS